VNIQITIISIICNKILYQGGIRPQGTDAANAIP